MTAALNSKLSSVLDSYNVLVLNPNLLVKVFCVTIFIGHLLSYITSAADLFCIFPGKLVPPNFAIWTVVTYCFIEPHIWLVACNVVVVFMYGKVVEPLWGSLEMIRFYGIVSTFVGVLTVSFYLLEYLFTVNTDVLFLNPVYGMSGYAAGLTVVLKQTMGDQILINSPLVKVRTKHIPLVAACTILVARIIYIVPPPHLIQFLFGLVVSWTYLRFYQKHKDGTKGDSAEGFSFVSFFPEAINPYVGIFSNTIFALLVKLKICSSPHRKFEFKAPVVSLSMTGTDVHDAERRRKLALKALNERLNKVSALPWPNMEDTMEEGLSVFKSEEKTLAEAREDVTVDIEETSKTNASSTTS